MSEHHAQPTAPASTRAEALEGIEGWLVLPMLYLLSVAFFTAGALLYTELPWARPELLAGNVACLVGAVVLLSLFLKKLAIVPPLMIVFYVVVAGVTMLEYLAVTRFSEGIDPRVIAAEADMAREALGHTIPSAIIWIPYFAVSQRVRNTFVE